MTSYSAFLHFLVLGYALFCLKHCEGKFVDVPKEEITPPPVTASTNGWRPLLPTTEKVSVPAANAQRGGHHRQSVTTITPYVTVHPVLGKLHAHLETAERNKRLQHQPHATRVDIYSHTPPSILGSFTVFGHATVKSRNTNKPPKKNQILDSETSETRISAAGRLVPPPVPQTISLTRFPADSAFKFGFETVDKHRPTYYLPLPQKDAAFHFLSPPKTDKYYYTSVGEFPSHYSNLGATQILPPLPQSQYFPQGSISHTSTKFGDSDVVKFLPQSTDIQVDGGESVGTSKPHQVFLSPPRVQDNPQVSVTPSTHQVFGRVQDNPVTPISQQLFAHPGRVQDTPVTPNTQQVFLHSGRVQETVLHNQNSGTGNSQQIYVHSPQVSVSTSSPQQAFVHPGRLQDSALYKQEKLTTSVPTQVTFVQQGKVQDVSLHNNHPQSIPDEDTREFFVYQRKKNKQQYETTTASAPKWSPEDPYRAKLAQESSSAAHFKKDQVENVGSVLNQLLDGRILPGSTPLTFEKDELPLTTTPVPQEVPKKVYYPPQQTFAQLPALRGTAEKPRIARPYFDQDRTIRNEQDHRNHQHELSDVIPSGPGSLHTSVNLNTEHLPIKHSEVWTTRKPLKPLLPTPLTEEEVEEVEEEEYTAQNQLEEEQNEIRTQPPRRPSVHTRLPPADADDDEKPREQRPYRLRRPVTRRPVTDPYEEDNESHTRTPAVSQREPADDSTSTHRERWRTNANRPERNRNRNRYTERHNDSEYLKQKRRRRPTYASEYNEDELTTIPADYQFSALGNEDATTTSTTTPVYSEYRKPNRGRERHRNRLPPVHRRVVTTSTTPPTAPAEEPSDINWQQDDYVYEHNNHNSQSTLSNIFDESHTLNEIYEADEFTSTKSSTTPTTSTTTTTTAPATTTTTTTTPEPTTVISITTTPEPTTTSAALRIRNRYRYRANSTRPRFSVKDYKERLTKLSSIAHSSPGGEPQDQHHNTGSVQINEEIRNEGLQESVKTSTDEEHPSSFDITKTDEAIKEVKTEVTSSTTAPSRIRQPLRTRGSYFYGSTSSTTTTTTTTEPSTRSRYRQREHSRYNPSLRGRYSTTSTTTTTASPLAVSTSTERLNLFKPQHVRQYRPGLKYSRYRSSTEAPAVEESANAAAAADEDSKTRSNANLATRKPYPYRSRYSAKITSSTEKPADTDAANSDVTEMTSSETLKTPKETTAPMMSEKIDTTTSESQEVLDGDWSTTLGMPGLSASTTTSISDSNSIVQSSVTDLPTFAPAYHEDQEDLSQRIADLTSSASSAGYFKTMAPPQRTNLRITMATDDPILPIEAFFPVRSKGGDRR